MNQPPLTESEEKQLITKAEAARKKAYAPYSQFQVGAALLTHQGKIFTGCNVENASYGLTMCAERNAIATAIAEEGADNLTIKAITQCLASRDRNCQQPSCSLFSLWCLSPSNCRIQY